MTGALRFTVVLLAVLWASAPSEVAAQTEPRSVNAVTISSPAAGDTFKRGETITVTVNFNRDINNQATCQSASNPLRLEVQIGATTRDFRCPGGNAIYGRDHPFSYVVQAGDLDADGISIAAGAIVGGTWWAPGSNTIDTDLGTHAITNSANHKVDASQFPTGGSGVTGLALNTPVLGGTFERGEGIDVTVTFNRAVDVTGTPQLGLGIGSNTRQASYVSGTGTASLVFRYTVVTADVDSNGLSIAAGALGLNSGTINTAGTTTNTLLGLGAHAITDSANHLVDGGTLTAAAASGVSITSTPAGGDTYYRLGEVIQVTVTFNRAVSVNTPGGIPQLALTVGSNTRQSALSSIPGSRDLVFSYTVAAGDFDADGIGVAADALALNGGTINDARSATTAAALGLGTHAITNDAAHKVAAPPRVLSLSVNQPANFAGASGTFERGERIEGRVFFNRAVDVTGTPQLALDVGGVERQADYVSGSGLRLLVFRYTVQGAGSGGAGTGGVDADTDGISIAAGALTLNGGTIRASAADRTDADRGLAGRGAFSNDSARLVNGGLFTTSAASAVSIASSPASGDTYSLGERIEVRVTFTRRVEVTGTPQLALTVGVTTRQADYASGSGTNALTFRYVVQGAGSGGNGASGTDEDVDGISIAANALALNGGTIYDARDATAAATLTHSALATQANHKADGLLVAAPNVADVAVESAPAGGSYSTGAAIRVRVTFDRLVRVAGTPTLALVIGSERRQASYVSGSGTPALVFRYVVQAGDSDPDGFSVPADALSGTIELAGGVADGVMRPAAALDLGTHALPDQAGHAVEGLAPEPDEPPPVNRAPEVVAAPGAVALDVDGTAAIALAGAFRDPEGDPLTLSATSSRPAVATARLNETTLALAAVAEGQTRITVRAADPDGATAGLSFLVTVGNPVSIGGGDADDMAPVVVSAPEGGVAEVPIAMAEPREADVSFAYSFGPDGDAATADADAADHGGEGGTVVISAGETEATIRISILDDDVIEPARESFAVTLTPMDGAGVAVSSAVVHIAEGVCDRSWQVADALRGGRACEAVTPAELSRRRTVRLPDAGLAELNPLDFLGMGGLTVLILDGNGLSALPEGLLTGSPKLRVLRLRGNRFETLPALGSAPELIELDLADNLLTELPAQPFGEMPALGYLYLGGNQIEALPADLLAEAEAIRILELQDNALAALPEGVFAGVPRLVSLQLQDNPGAPFALPVELAPVAAEGESGDGEGEAGDGEEAEEEPGRAEIQLRVPHGAPFAISAAISAPGATLSAQTATIAAGETLGSAVSVVRDVAGNEADAAVTVAIDSVTSLPTTACGDEYDEYRCFSGFELRTGGPLTLFDPPAADVPTMR